MITSEEIVFETQFKNIFVSLRNSYFVLERFSFLIVKPLCQLRKLHSVRVPLWGYHLNLVSFGYETRPAERYSHEQYF